jgi:hypothetical protein
MDHEDFKVRRHPPRQLGGEFVAAEAAVNQREHRREPLPRETLKAL